MVVFPAMSDLQAQRERLQRRIEAIELLESLDSDQRDAIREILTDSARAPDPRGRGGTIPKVKCPRFDECHDYIAIDRKPTNHWSYAGHPEPVPTRYDKDSQAWLYEPE